MNIIPRPTFNESQHKSPGFIFIKGILCIEIFFSELLKLLKLPPITIYDLHTVYNISYIFFILPKFYVNYNNVVHIIEHDGFLAFIV